MKGHSTLPTCERQSLSHVKTFNSTLFWEVVISGDFCVRVCCQEASLGGALHCAVMRRRSCILLDFHLMDVRFSVVFLATLLKGRISVFSNLWWQRKNEFLSSWYAYRCYWSIMLWMHCFWHFSVLRRSSLFLCRSQRTPFWLQHLLH